MKKFLGILLLFIVVVVTVLYFARDFLLKEYLERKMSKANNAPVTIGSVDLDYFESYVTLKDIKIMSNLHKDEIFISIDELKSYYEIDFSKKVITFDDTEIEGIAFFKDANYENSDREGVVTFENKVTEAEEKTKRDKVLMELKTLYLNKIEENHLNLNEILSRNLNDKSNMSELEKIKQSIKNIKESSEKNLNISDVVGEISNIGKSTKKLGKDLKLDNLNKTEEDIKEGLTLEESLDRVVRNFLDRNKLVLFDLDGYINMYLNLVYEQKIYNLSLKYRDILDEIRLRKEEDSKLSDGDIWELFFNSISVTSNVYGISFNGEVKNFSTRLSKNKGDTVFKLFGEKGNTIGEFKGFINFNTELTESTLNIPEADLKDLGSDLLKGGEGVLFQSLSTNGYHLAINGSIHLKNMKLDIDKEKVGVMGGSYGGFMTNWIIGHTNRFAAACSQRSISNWISKFGITDIGYYFNSDQNGGVTPWKGVEKMWDHSPLKYADKCKTPTLFIQSDEDYRCFEACAFQMFTALKYHGCEAKLVLFHGENHDIRRPLQIQPTNMQIRDGIQIHNVNGQLRIRVHIHALQGEGRHINQSFLVHAYIGGILQNLSLPLAGSVGIPGLVKHLNAHSRSSRWARLPCSARSCLAIWAAP